MATAKALREQTTEELKAAHLDLSKEIFRLHNEQALTRKVEKPHRLKLLKKDRARVLTILRERDETSSEGE